MPSVSAARRDRGPAGSSARAQDSSGANASARCSPSSPLPSSRSCWSTCTGSPASASRRCWGWRWPTRATAGRRSCAWTAARSSRPSGGSCTSSARRSGSASDDVADVAARLGGLGARVVLALDNYEVFRLMDAWLRQVFVPALDANVRVLMAGREPPLPAWFASTEWQGLFRSVPLGPLEERRGAASCSAGSDAADDAAVRINRVARGHPLALKLAASALTERPDLGLEEAAMQRVVEELTRVFLADVRDPLTRRALDAASVVRRATQPLLRRDAARRRAAGRLRAPAGAALRRDQPRRAGAPRGGARGRRGRAAGGRPRPLRRVPPRRLAAAARARLPTAGTPELWRYTADALYLIENPTVREAFFPSGAQAYAVEPARAGRRRGDRAPSGSPTSRRVGRRCSRPGGPRRPRRFSVDPRPGRRSSGFYAMFDPATMRRGLLWSRSGHARLGRAPARPSGADRARASCSCAAGWARGRGRTVADLRPPLAGHQAHATWSCGPASGACTRRCGDLADLGPGRRAAALRAARRPGRARRRRLHSAMLDFGPSSVDGWLADLVAEELGVERRTWSVDAGRGRAAARRPARRPDPARARGASTSSPPRGQRSSTARTLLAEVWGSDYEGGSNIVDSVVRSLRKKLGAGPRRSRRCAASATGSGAPEPAALLAGRRSGQWAGAGSPAASAWTASVVRHLTADGPRRS